MNDIAGKEAQLDSLVAEIKKTGRKAIKFIGDVSDATQVEALVQASVKALGPLNTMVANAGIAQVKPLLDLTPEDMERMFQINVFGVHNCYTIAAKQFIKQGTAGKLIGAASIVAYKPFPLLVHYSAAKFAVKGLTQGTAMELAKYKITCNAYAPGIVGTAMWDLIDEELGKADGRPRGETIKKYSQDLILLGRTSVPTDVAKTVSFLASPDSDYMTGQTIVIDGGIQFA